jgi:hypothetical protein
VQAQNGALIARQPFEHGFECGLDFGAILTEQRDESTIFGRESDRRTRRRTSKSWATCFRKAHSEYETSSNERRSIDDGVAAMVQAVGCLVTPTCMICRRTGTQRH